jgi:hypothetical protein
VGWYGAWVLSWYWLWFATPLGAPAVGSWHMFGIYLGARIVVIQHAPARRDWTEDLWQLPTKLAFVSTALLVGWVIKELM